MFPDFSNSFGTWNVYKTKNSDGSVGQDSTDGLKLLSSNRLFWPSYLFFLYIHYFFSPKLKYGFVCALDTTVTFLISVVQMTFINCLYNIQ